MSTTLDDVIETVLRAREDGPEALAAMALSFGAAMELGTLGNRALKARLAETRAAATAADEMLATLRHERDAALAECKAARQSVDEAKADAARLRALVESAADTAEVWRLRESVAALRADRARAVAERDRAVQERDEARSIAAMRDRALTAAVQEREAFSLRLSAAEHARDENRNAWAEACRERDALRDRPTYEARTVAPTPEERVAHEAAGARWLRCGSGRASVVCVYRTTDTGSRDGLLWIPIGPDGLPCAWPVPSAEVSP